MLRLLFSLTVVTGGLVELRQLAMREREYARHLEELARLKADFTAMVAHELRSPLAAIGGLAELLDYEGLDASERARCLAGLRVELAALRALTADVQAAASVERDDFEVNTLPVPLDVLLANAAAFAATLPGAHPLTVIPADARVLADPVRLGQVLRNLLDNAAKYSPPGAPIELRAVRRNRRVRIEVADEGVGIHPEDLARILGKFERGRNEQVEGVGLGLYMSRRIVAVHGSELTVSSRPGAGSVFGFELEVVR